MLLFVFVCLALRFRRFANGENISLFCECVQLKYTTVLCATNYLNTQHKNASINRPDSKATEIN